MLHRPLILLIFLFSVQPLRAQDCGSCNQWLHKLESSGGTGVKFSWSAAYLENYIFCLWQCGDSLSQQKAITFNNYKELSFSQDKKIGWALDRFNNSYYLIDTNGNKLLELDPAWSTVNAFKSNKALLQSSKGFAFLSSTGKILPLTYKSVNGFSDGLAGVYDGKKGGYINTEGKLVIPLLFSSVGYFQQGMSAVALNGKYGVINKKGNFIVRPDYDYIDVTPSGILVTRGKDRWLMDLQGKVLIPTGMEIYYPNEFGNFSLTVDGKKGLADRTGKWLVKPGYLEIRQMTDSVCWIFKNQQWYFLKIGTDSTDPRFSYEFNWQSATRYLTAIKGKAQGVVDMYTGDTKVPVLYSFLDGYRGQPILKAKKSNKTGFINLKNETVIPFEFEEVYEQDPLTIQMRGSGRFTVYTTDGKRIFSGENYCGQFCNGVARFFKDFPYKFGYFNIYGKVIVPPVYDDVQSHHTGLAWVRKNGLYGYVDISGKLVLPLIYSSAGEFNKGQALVVLNGDMCVINTQGEIIRKAGEAPGRYQKSVDGPEPPLKIKGK